MAAVSAVFWVVLFFGVIDLLVPIERTPGFYDSYLLETGWGLVYTFLVGAAFVALAVRPSLVLPPVQVALVGLCLALTGLASGSFGSLSAVALVGNAYAVARLAHGAVPTPPGWRRPHVDVPLTVLALLLAAPAMVFAFDMIAGYRSGRPPTDDDTWGLDHWPTQAALALGVVAVALAVAAGVRGRRSGTVVSAACVAVTAGWFGVVSVVHPSHAGSIGEAWAPPPAVPLAGVTQTHGVIDHGTRMPAGENGEGGIRTRERACRPLLA